MKSNLTPIASGVALFLMGAAMSAHAQTAAPIEQVVTTGIRASLQQSLTQKRNADTHVDVITAEDIGKMPDKNVADSLQRVPGVTISSAGATEGGFDENDRVSMRGTNPSLTQTTINGHLIGSGDWFVLNQSGAGVGRSVSYSLLPSELVGKVVVSKAASASQVEGGTTGSVDIQTRRPLEFKNAISAEASIGVVYSDLAKKTDPQLSGLFNWKNDSNTMGVMVQAFSEKRHLRRDGQEVLGYETVQASNPVVAAHPDLLGVAYPKAIGSVLFEQERKRTGGLIDFEIKPTNDLKLNFDAFSSKMEAGNYNRNYLLWNPLLLGNGEAPLPGYVIRNNTLVQASFAPRAGNGSNGVYDQISRPDASDSSNYFNFDANWRVNDALTMSGKLGTSKGSGKSPTQDVIEWDTGHGASAGWTLHGVGAIDWNQGAASTSTPGTSSVDWIFGIQNQIANDKETYAQVDGEYALGGGLFSDVKFGLRATKHDRSVLGSISQGPLDSAFLPANFPTTYSNYPANFGSNLGGTFPRDIWYYSPAQLAAFDLANTNRNPIQRAYPFNDAVENEKTSAAYVQGDFKSEGYSGNLGVRLVSTKEVSTVFVPSGAAAPGAITGSLFGVFAPSVVANDYHDVLPSLNLKFDLAKDLVARLAISRTMTRPDYGSLASGVGLSPPSTLTQIGTGTGSNPKLNPIRSNNLDLTLEYYFAKRSLLSVSGFYQDLTSYTGLGTTRQYFNTIASFTQPADPTAPNVGVILPYDIVAPTNISARVGGVELGLNLPIGANFGVDGNYTYIDARDSSNGPVVGASKNTGNISGYFEDDKFNARLTYTYRSSFYSGVDRATSFTQDAIGNVAASLGYKISDNFALTFDAHNLNNPTLKYYAANRDQPRSIYENGRQYYLTLRAKM